MFFLNSALHHSVRLFIYDSPDFNHAALSDFTTLHTAVYIACAAESLDNGATHSMYNSILQKHKSLFTTISVAGEMR